MDHEFEWRVYADTDRESPRLLKSGTESSLEAAKLIAGRVLTGYDSDIQVDAQVLVVWHDTGEAAEIAYGCRSRRGHHGVRWELLS